MSIEENLKENKSTKENCSSQRWSQLATFLVLFLLISFLLNPLKCIYSSDTGGAWRHWETRKHAVLPCRCAFARPAQLRTLLPISENPNPRYSSRSSSEALRDSSRQELIYVVCIFVSRCLWLSWQLPPFAIYYDFYGWLNLPTGCKSYECGSLIPSFHPLQHWHWAFAENTHEDSEREGRSEGKKGERKKESFHCNLQQTFEENGNYSSFTEEAQRC